MTQLGPIMKQLSGVDLEDLLQNISRLPGVVADNIEGGRAKAKTSDTGKVFGED
jgi:hypothetical protein